MEGPMVSLGGRRHTLLLGEKTTRPAFSVSTCVGVQSTSFLAEGRIFYYALRAGSRLPSETVIGDFWARVFSREEMETMVVGIDDSPESFYALECTLDRFFVPFSGKPPFKLVIVNAKPSATSAIGLAGPGAADVLPFVEADLKKIAVRAVEKAKELCTSKSVNDVTAEILEGDPRNVLCEAVERHQAAILVVGSHGRGTIRRVLLGSVSDYCAHHAHCSVMIVKKPKTKP